MKITDRIKSIASYDLSNLKLFSRKKKAKGINLKASKEDVKKFFQETFKNDPEQAAYAYEVYEEVELQKRIKETRSQLDRNIEKSRAAIQNRYTSLGVTETVDEGIYGYSTRDEVRQDQTDAEIERSLKDPKVRAALNVLLSPVFTDDLVVKQYGGEDKSAELKEYAESLMDEIKGTFKGKLKEGVKTALAFQNCFFEIVPKWSEHPDFKGKRVISEFMSKRPGLLEFVTDDYDNVLALHSLINFNEYYDLDRFFILGFNHLFSNPYGETLFASYFKFWKAKLIIFQDMAVYSNRYSQPIPKVTYSDDSVAAQAQAISDHLYSGANIALPDSVQAEFLKAIESGTQNPFIVILEWLDRQISLAICGIDLSQGSYAADKVIQEERALYVKDLQRELEDQIYEQIIKRFISANFDNTAYPINIYPRIEFQEQKKPESLNDFMSGCRVAYDLGVIDPNNRINDNNHIRVKLGFEELTQEEFEEIEEVELEGSEEEEQEESEEDDNFSFYEFMKKEKVTDFPEKGDNKKVSLRNSNYPLFDNRFAKSLKENYPEIWDDGGNIRGNEAFNLAQKALKGEYTPAVLDWIREREAWAARHYENKNIAGVVAQIKWLVIGSRGEDYMKNLINEKKESIKNKVA